MAAGVSTVFSDEAFLPVAYAQATACLSYNDRDGLLRFDDILTEEIRRNALEHRTASYYVHPVFRMIRDYDEKYHLNYLDTFRIYLRHQGNLRDTADMLGIHYNTMKHRLSVIEDIIGIRIRDDHILLEKLMISSLFLSAMHGGPTMRRTRPLLGRRRTLVWRRWSMVS